MINNKIWGLVGFAARARKVCFGADSVEQEIKKEKVKLVLIAEDSSERTKTKFQKICNDNNVDIIDTDFGANVTIKLAAEMSVCDTFEKKLMDTFAGNVVLNDKENVKFCRNMAGNIIFL